MTNWSFRDVGSFDNEAAVDQWARENRVDPRDVKTRAGAGGRIEAEVRESAMKGSQNDVFGGYDRGSGFR